MNFEHLSLSLKLHKGQSFSCGDICKTILTSNFNSYGIFPKFCTSKVFICEYYTRIFGLFGILLSKCPGNRGKMAYVSLHKLPHCLRNKLKI